MRKTDTAIRAVILAAGSSSRTAPVQKLLTLFRGRRLIDYAIEGALLWRPVVVAGEAVARALGNRDDCSVLLNEYPERGMSHSLKVADAALPPQASLLVFLADKPLVCGRIVHEVCATQAQVAFPVHIPSGRPGHPVFLHASVRSHITRLSDGDTLHHLRDDPRFVRRPVPTTDEGPFFDVDDLIAV